jgi:hypothetical protein
MDGEVSSGKKKPISGNSGTLAQEIMSSYEPTMKKLGLLSTPTAMDSTNATVNMKSNQLTEGSMHSVTLTRAMVMGLLPTPTLQEYTNSTLPPSQIKRNNIPGVLLRQGVLAHSQLNPLFVEQMMGFPKNWTALPFQNGETKASKPTETQ